MAAVWVWLYWAIWTIFTVKDDVELKVESKRVQ